MRTEQFHLEFIHHAGFAGGIYDISSTLTTGGFVATLVALVLAIVAYVISRKAQRDAQRSSMASAEKSGDSGGATVAEPPAEKKAGASKSKASEKDAGPYRWD